jgi:hypothetical protein
VAQVRNEDVHIEAGEVLVERKIVPAARDRSAPLGLIVLLAFIVTGVVVFLGDRLGIREIGPRRMVEVGVHAPQRKAANFASSNSATQPRDPPSSPPLQRSPGSDVPPPSPILMSAYSARGWHHSRNRRPARAFVPFERR